MDNIKIDFQNSVYTFSEDKYESLTEIIIVP